MIGRAPVGLPSREYTDYRGETVEQLGDVLQRRNPLAQTSVSALRDVKVCRRMHFFKHVVGLKTPSHPAALEGSIMHEEVETWHRGGPRPKHPSVLAAIEEGLIPAPDATVLSEEEFWTPTGVATPRSPDGQVWMHGYVDLVVQEGDHVRVLDMKSKKDPDACMKYGLTPEELAKDEQMGLYGHTFFGQGAKTLQVGHIYLVRNRDLPYARAVTIPLTKETARSTYLRLLDAAETAVKDAGCRDWQAVPGNFAKCDRPFVCPFIPICHGTPKEDSEVVSPLAQAPVTVIPPDAAPPLESAPAKKTKKENPQMTLPDDNFDDLLNQAMGLPPAASKPAPAAPPPAPKPAPAATVKATPVPGDPGGDEASLDALLDAAEAKATEAVSKKRGKKASDPAPAPVDDTPKVSMGNPDPKAPSPDVEAALARLKSELKAAEAKAEAKASKAKAEDDAKAQATAGVAVSKPIELLLVGCFPESGGTMLADLVGKVDAVVVENHNKQPGVQKIASMYQLDHGMWRGPFVGILQSTVRAMAAKSGPLTVVALGDSPAASTAVEALAPLAARRIWGR